MSLARGRLGSWGESTRVRCSSTSAAAPDTNWHHVVGTFASGALKLYVDGALSASATAAFTSAGTNTSTLDLGHSGTSNFYGGSLDEIALYATALSATEVQSHYQATSALPNGNAAPSEVFRGFASPPLLLM